MTNFEYYKDQLKCMADNKEVLAMRAGKITACEDTSCEECDFNVKGFCRATILQWLCEEHNVTLTAREYNILKAIGEGYLTKDQDGKICVNVSKPEKYSAAWISSKKRMTAMFWSEELFNFIKWEDEEPYSIEEMLTWEHEEE